jgi:hypothetical protein
MADVDNNELAVTSDHVVSAGQGSVGHATIYDSNQQKAFFGAGTALFSLMVLLYLFRCWKVSNPLFRTQFTERFMRWHSVSQILTGLGASAFYIYGGLAFYGFDTTTVDTAWGAWIVFGLVVASVYANVMLHPLGHPDTLKDDGFRIVESSYSNYVLKVATTCGGILLWFSIGTILAYADGAGAIAYGIAFAGVTLLVLGGIAYNAFNAYRLNIVWISIYSVLVALAMAGYGICLALSPALFAVSSWTMVGWGYFSITCFVLLMSIFGHAVVDALQANEYEKLYTVGSFEGMGATEASFGHLNMHGNAPTVPAPANFWAPVHPKYH